MHQHRMSHLSNLLCARFWGLRSEQCRQTSLTSEATHIFKWENRQQQMQKMILGYIKCYQKQKDVAVMGQGSLSVRGLLSCCLIGRSEPVEGHGARALWKKWVGTNVLRWGGTDCLFQGTATSVRSSRVEVGCERQKVNLVQRGSCRAL